MNLKAFMVVMAIAHTMDIVSSCPGMGTQYREANPLVPSNCVAIAAETSAFSATVDYTAIVLKRRNHERTAKWILGAITAGEVAIAVRNWKQRPNF